MFSIETTAVSIGCLYRVLMVAKLEKKIFQRKLGLAPYETFSVL